MKLKNKADMFISKTRQCIWLQFINILSVDIDNSGIRSVECTEDMQQGAFSGPWLAYDADNFAFGNVEAYAFQDLKVTVGFLYILYVYHVAFSIDYFLMAILI